MSEEAAKAVTAREIIMWAEVEPSSYYVQPHKIDMADDETLDDWIERQERADYTPMDLAKDLDLLSEVGVYIQVVEKYDDGTRHCVAKRLWSPTGGTP